MNSAPMTIPLEKLAEVLLADTSDAGMYATYLSVLDSERNHYFTLTSSGGIDRASVRDGDAATAATTTTTMGAEVRVLSEWEVHERIKARDELRRAAQRRVEV